jgi:hypothetical protein
MASDPENIKYFFMKSRMYKVKLAIIMFSIFLLFILSCSRIDSDRNTRSDIETTTRVSADDLRAWPVEAWIDVTFIANKMHEYGVSSIDLDEAVKHTACSTLSDIRKIGLKSSSGKQVLLGDVAIVDVALVRRGSSKALGDNHPLGATPARIALRAKQTGTSGSITSAIAVDNLLSQLELGRKYTLTEIRNWPISRSNGTSIVLDSAAEVKVISKNGSIWFEE